MNYLDSAATTRPYSEVVTIVKKTLEENFANPSSVHPAGLKAREMVNTARETLADIFQVPQAGILFCGSGTESDNFHPLPQEDFKPLDDGTADTTTLSVDDTDSFHD